MKDRSDLELGLPAGVLYEMGPVHMPADTETSDAERAAVSAAVLKRQREFLSGRAAARRLLTRLGHSGGDLLPQPSRAPAWPAGIVGSISHCDRAFLVVAAPSSVLGGIGIDCEPDEPLPPELWERICSPRELAWLESQEPASRGCWARRFFSAKEAVYKYQYPRTARFLGFQEVEIAFDSASCQFQTRWTGAEAENGIDLSSVLEAAEGAWTVRDGLVVCVAFQQAAFRPNPAELLQ